MPRPEAGFYRPFCPGGGAPILLLPDCGTTGGYPRAARVIRADRHLLGQIRPGDDVRLLEWSEEDAVRVLDEKTALLDDLVRRSGRLFFTHDPEVAACGLSQNDRGHVVVADPVPALVS